LFWKKFLEKNRKNQGKTGFLKNLSDKDGKIRIILNPDFY